jgi:hypothetical protein
MLKERTTAERARAEAR